MPGEFDWDAATDVDLNTNDSGTARLKPLSEIAARMAVAQSDLSNRCSNYRVLAQLSLEGVENRQRELFTRFESSFFASANGRIREEINKDSGYANVVPHRAKIEK